MVSSIEGECFHCGEALQRGTPALALVAGQMRPVCCAGCKAVAELIDAQGLHAYYATRAALPASTPDWPTADADDSIFDHAEVQQEFVHESADDVAETELILEGITCAACLWLNERRLQSLPGVLSTEVNYTTRRARVRWDKAHLHLSEILAAVRALGYRAFPSTSQAAEASRRRELRTLLWRMAVAALGMMQVMMYALPAYIAQDGAMTADIAQLLRWASLSLTVPVMFYACAPFFLGAWRDLRNRSPGMDVPIALGLAVSFFASVVNTVRGHGEVYFDSVTMFAFLLLLARHIELNARQQATRSLDYVSRAMPLRASRLKNYPADDGNELIPAISLHEGDVVLVRPGETIPADGVIVRGETQVDESLLTGESWPVLRALGDEVVAGAINRLSPVWMRVERTGEHTRASHIARLMMRAAAERPRITQVTQRMAAYFVMAVLGIAFLSALAWFFVDPSKALWTGVAVLVVTCPCALSLATPSVFAIATAELARRGVVVTRANAIETLASASHFVFDKTGTLTQGQLSLIDVTQLSNADRETCRTIAAALEAHSEHPIGRALMTDTKTSTAIEVRNIPGSGIEGDIDGRRYRLGSARFTGATPQTLADVSSANYTSVWLADDQQVLARFDLADSLRMGTAAALRALRRDGAQLFMLSGDCADAVRGVARLLDIKQFRFGMSPEDKLDFVRALQASGARVVMLGDGVNDAPVLAQADLSIAMGSGAALSQAHADIVITSPSLLALRDGLHLARRAMRILRQNLMWALGYNLVAIPLAVSGLLTPWMAGLGMATSSLFVVLNSLRLRSHRGRRREAVTRRVPAVSPA